MTTVVCFLSIGLPLVQLLSTKRTWTELPGALAAGQSASWNSFCLAVLSATVVVALALAPRMGGGGRGSRGRFDAARWMGSLLWLPFLLPGILIGIGLIAIFNRPWFSALLSERGDCGFSVSDPLFRFRLEHDRAGCKTVDPDLLDVARLEGASRWQSFRHVQWPQIGSQIAAVWYLVFLLCLWDVESMILVVPPGGETLALRIFNLLHYGHNAQVNALCLTLLALALAPVLVWKGGLGVRNAWRLLGHRGRGQVPRTPLIPWWFWSWPPPCRLARRHPPSAMSRSEPPL